MSKQLWAAVALATAALGSAHTVARSAIQDPYPRAASAYLVVMDDKPLWAHRPELRRPPASLTKLLTALVVLQSDWRADARITISRDALRVLRPRLDLRPGDSLSAADALTAMLIGSDNDACMALVEHASASVVDFVVRLNDLARRLGMHDSHFAHPCGFDAEDQYSTAGDLLKLAKAAYADPHIARVVSRESATITAGSGQTVQLSNTNQLLGRLQGVAGVKTGYTARAGYCLIAYAERSGHHVWLVLLDSRQRWWTAHRIITDALAVASDSVYSVGN